jgi:hypothetical protein
LVAVGFGAGFVAVGFGAGFVGVTLGFGVGVTVGVADGETPGVVPVAVGEVCGNEEPVGLAPDLTVLPAVGLEARSPIVGSSPPPNTWKWITT